MVSKYLVSVYATSQSNDIISFNIEAKNDEEAASKAKNLLRFDVTRLN